MAVTPPPRPPGSDAAHPLFVRQAPEMSLPGHTASPDPIVVATQQTAQYTLGLTIATFLLFLGTIIALIVGEVQRRAGVRDAEKARTEQYKRDKALNDATLADLQGERDNQSRLREEEAEHRRVAGVAQLVTILQAYQRAVNLLLMAPNYPIASRARTMQSLLTRALSDSIVSVIPTDVRNTIITAVVKAQETLEASADNQKFHVSMHADLEREGIITTRLAERLTEAKRVVDRLSASVAREGDPKAKVALQERLFDAERWLASLKASPDAIDSTRFVATEKQRAAKLATIYPTITDNARDADRVLREARAVLGDDTDMTFIPQEAPPTEPA